MRDVHCTDAHLGSFTWKLPPDLAGSISALPDEVQVELQAMLETHLQRHLLMLAGTLQIGEMAARAFSLIEDNESRTLFELKRVAEGTKTLEAPRYH